MCCRCRSFKCIHIFNIALVQLRYMFCARFSVFSSHFCSLAIVLSHRESNMICCCHVGAVEVRLPFVNEHIHMDFASHTSLLTVDYIYVFAYACKWKNRSILFSITFCVYSRFRFLCYSLSPAPPPVSCVALRVSMNGSMYKSEIM